MTEALHLTPHGMPVVAYPISLTLIAFAVWSSLRDSDVPWFRWLTPIGTLATFTGLLLINLWIAELGIFVGCAGLGLTRYASGFAEPILVTKRVPVRVSDSSNSRIRRSSDGS
jgi:hypothetical protein